jgi:hypothetical protein
MFSKVSSTISATSNTTNGSTTAVTADIRLNIVASGGDILVASTTATIGLKNSAGTVVASSTVIGLTDGGLTTYSEGNVRPVRFVAVFTPAQSALITTGNYTAVIESLKYATSTGATWFNLTDGFQPLETDNSTTIIK